MTIVLHLAGNALLLWLGYYWLGLAESRASTLAWSATVAIVILAGACWLYGAALADRRAALRHLPWTVIVALAGLAVGLAIPSARWRWIVVPLLFLPLFAGAARHGLRMWREFRNPRWLAAPLFAFLAVWVPLRLLAWVPKMSSFGLEMTSFVLRAAVAYVLFVAAGLALARLIPTQVASKYPVTH